MYYDRGKYDDIRSKLADFFFSFLEKSDKIILLHFGVYSSKRLKFMRPILFLRNSILTNKEQALSEDRGDRDIKIKIRAYLRCSNKWSAFSSASLRDMSVLLKTKIKDCQVVYCEQIETKLIMKPK